MSKGYKYILSVIVLFSMVRVSAQEKVWTLDDCIAYALQENIQVKQAELGNRQAELYFERSRAARHPSANASVSQSLNWSKPVDNTGAYGNYEMDNGTSYSLNSNVTLYNGLKLQNQVRQSELDLKSNSYYTEVVKESVELSILDAFLQVLYAQESVKNADRQIELTEDQLFLAGERLALGAISQADYLQIKSELASEKLTLSDAESQLILAKLNLMQLMELPVTSGFSVASPEIDSILNENRMPDVNQVFEFALDTKPEIKQAEISEKSALLDEKIAKADLFPSLSLSAGVGTQAGLGIADYTYFESLSNQVSPHVGLSLSVPIYQKKQARTNISLARIGAEQAVLNTLNTKNTLRKEVEQAAANVVIAQQQFEASREDYEVATESMKVADEKFELGMINSVDFLFERTAYILSESKLLQNKYKLIFSYKVLDYYKGLELTL